MEENTISVLSNEQRIFEPGEALKNSAHIKSMEEYEALYKRSVEDPDGFWGEEAEKNLDWIKRWDSVCDYEFDTPEISYFRGGRLNASVNCLDRHCKTWRKNKAAIIWEGDNGEYRTYTYQQLYYEVNRFANVLRRNGVKKGDRVTLYLPMIPEITIACLACARIGAIHSVVFGGFSPSSLKDRIEDCESEFVVTADEGVRGGKAVPLKVNCDEAIKNSSVVKKVFVVKRTGGAVSMKEGRDLWWHDEMDLRETASYCEPESMDSESPLFILYTSGSTGKPKAVLHTTAGYLLYTNLTFKYIFDYHEEDIHFCTADIGWVTGHSYIIYGPLSNGATSLMFEGVPNYPAPDRFWRIVEKHSVSILYTAPTAIRALMREGESWAEKYPMKSLRVLGSVGEPINPEAWIWYHKVVGKGKLPIVDTWWQTETGGILISPLPGATPLKPGSATKPFFGVVPRVLRADGEEASVNEGGYLVVDRPWPGMLRGTYGDPDNKRVKDVYFSRFPGCYFTGDGARVDEDGFFWLMGRIDDVVNVSGHRIGTAEIESALVSHPYVAEAAAVGFPHEIKGDGIYVYVILKADVKESPSLTKELMDHVRNEISPIAKPEKIQIVTGLPKTRSGKIMRRILRKVAGNELENLGDTSTLADPSIVKTIVDGRL